MSDAADVAITNSYGVKLEPGPVFSLAAVMGPLGLMAAAAYVLTSGITGGLATLIISLPMLAFLEVAACSIVTEQSRWKFAVAQRSLCSAAEALPFDSEERNLLLEFNNKAEALFILGHIAALQERLLSGKGSARRLRRQHEKGLGLIDDLALRMNWQYEERQHLRTLFEAGHFPKAEVFNAKLRKDIRDIQSKLRTVNDTYRPLVAVCK